MMNQSCSEAGGFRTVVPSSEIRKGKEKNVETAAPERDLNAVQRISVSKLDVC